MRRARTRECTVLSLTLSLSLRVPFFRFVLLCYVIPRLFIIIIIIMNTSVDRCGHRENERRTKRK